MSMIDPLVSLGGLLGGVAVGLTGIGGGALLTPMLVYVFNVPAGTAVGSDLLASLMMKPVSGIVHLRTGTVRLDVVRWLAIGSVPGAIGGSMIAGSLSDDLRDRVITKCMGVALLLAAITMIVRAARARHRRSQSVTERIDPTDRIEHSGPTRRVATALLGLGGGVLVGLTSVGSGSIMIVVLTMLYPSLTSSELVGTDLVQAIPLVAAAAFTHVFVGDVRLGLTASLLIGAIPGAYLGASMSSARTTRIVKPALVLLLIATGARQVTA
jgi:uncharacterized membrane protein YfcA